MGLVEDEVNRMIREGSPVQAVPEPIIKNSRFPERKGRGRIPSALKIATTYSNGQPTIDRVVFLSVSRMDAGE